MSDHITITLDGERALQAKLGRAVQQLEHPGDLMEAIAGLLERNINLRFETKTDPAGHAWLPLSPATQARYRAEEAKTGQGKKQGTLLERTGQMRQRLTSGAGDEYAEAGFAPYLTKNGKWQIALLHEYGTQRMPRRQLLTDDPVAGTLGGQDRSDIVAEIEAWLSGVF